MPVAWLSLMSKTAKLFFPFAQASVARGISANSIIESFKLAGGGVGRKGIRRQIGLEVIRRVRGVEKKVSATKYIRKDRRHDISTIPTSLTDLLHDFSHKVRYQGVTSEGTPFESFVTVSTDDRISPSDALNTAMEFLDASPEEYGIAEIGNLYYEGVKKHPRLG